MHTDGERRITAYHEAGHAVAAQMRGAGELRSVTIEPTADYAGHTLWRGKPADNAFVTFAGPWAEARCQWPAADLTDEDEDGCIFADYLFAAWLHNAKDDGAEYKLARDADAQLLGDEFAYLVDVREETWAHELEDRWPVISKIAELIMSGESDIARLDINRPDPSPIGD